MFYIVSYLTIKYQCITLDLTFINLHLLANHVFMITAVLVLLWEQTNNTHTDVGKRLTPQLLKALVKIGSHSSNEAKV